MRLRMGEQFIDLFTAGAYALAARIYVAAANPALAWIFYLLASGSIVFAIVESALEQRTEFWLRHICAVCLGAVLTLTPRTIDISTLTYGAPGVIEQLFGTSVGAAPHLTYWIERLGANSATALRSLTHQTPFLAVPGFSAQVAELAADPASVNDVQVKANLDIWRRRIAPQILDSNPGLAMQLQSAGLGATFLNPVPADPQFVGTAAADRARSVREMLAGSGIDFSGIANAQASIINGISHDAGAVPWDFGTGDDQSVSVTFAQSYSPASARRLAMSDPVYDDALAKADTVLANLRSELPSGSGSVNVTSAEQIYDLLGRSILFSAGNRLATDTAARAAIGSLCQRTGTVACSQSMEPLVEAASKLRVPQGDRFNGSSWTTWLQQPIATTLLTITSLMLSTLSTLVVSVLPFALGVAKSMAILISMVGTWMLLWPGRARIALSWMVGPISFVSLWAVLFNLWSDIEPALAQIATAVGNSDDGSFSARRLMSIAIALGYMGLPSLALGIVYGESGRALYHASARLETALLMAWHTRGSIAAFGRRWIVNSPMVRRWNQRVYRAIGMGPLRSTGARSSGRAHGRPPAANRGMTMRSSSRTRANVEESTSHGETPDLFTPATVSPLAPTGDGHESSRRSKNSQRSGAPPNSRKSSTENN